MIRTRSGYIAVLVTLGLLLFLQDSEAAICTANCVRTQFGGGPKSVTVNCPNKSCYATDQICFPGKFDPRNTYRTIGKVQCLNNIITCPGTGTRCNHFVVDKLGAKQERRNGENGVLGGAV